MAGDEDGAWKHLLEAVEDNQARAEDLLRKWQSGALRPGLP
jgi:hypothetical protein